MRTHWIVALGTLFMLCGCRASWDLQRPTMETPTPTSTRQVASPVPPSPTLAPPTQTPLPTRSPTPAPTATVSTTPPSEFVRIQFEPGATAIALEDHLDPGESRRYALRATEGQTMRVYVSSFWIDLGIRGEDGGVLKRADDSLTFWRGALPATQNYILSLDLGGDASIREGVDFELSVLINPLGQPIQWWDYQDEERAYKLSYSDYFIEAPPPLSIPLMKGDPAFSLTFLGTEYFEHTNLDDVSLTVGTSNNPEIVSGCEIPVGRFESVQEEVIINSVTFQRGIFGEGAAGNLYLQEIYRTLHGDTCYEIATIIHSANIGAYGPGSGIRQYSYDEVAGKLREVLMTFTILGE